MKKIKLYDCRSIGDQLLSKISLVNFTININIEKIKLTVLFLLSEFCFMVKIYFLIQKHIYIHKNNVSFYTYVGSRFIVKFLIKTLKKYNIQLEKMNFEKFNVFCLLI